MSEALEDFEGWKGGDMPVPGETKVDVLCVNGSILRYIEAHQLDWRHHNDVPYGSDVIGWRHTTYPTKVAAELADAAEPKTYDVTQGQVGGSHYAALGEYQPIEVLKRWLTEEEFRGWVKGEAIVYLARERQKGGDKDLGKADHVLRYGMKLMGIE